MPLIFLDTPIIQSNILVPIANEGLFGYKGLDRPEGLLEASQACIQQATSIVAQVCNAQTDQEIAKTVKRVDTISDILCSVLDSAELIRNVHPDTAFVEASNQSCTLLHTFLNQLNTNQELYLSLKKVFERPAVASRLGDHERKVATLLLKDFEKSGVHMPLSTRQKFIELNDQILQLGQQFSSNAYPFVEKVQIDNPRTTLAGTPSRILDALCRGSNPKKISIPTHSEIAAILMKTANSDAARKGLYFALNSASRDQIYVLEEMLKKRAELAKLLGKPSYGHLYLDDKMASTPGNVNLMIDNVSSFLNNLAKSNYPIAQQEVDILLNSKKQLLKREDVNLEAWDRYFYARQIEPLLMSDLDIPEKWDNVSISPYFSVGNVFQGLSDVFEALYGVSLEVTDTVPGEVWHKDVRKLSVVHETEGIIGTIYCDLFERDGESRKFDMAAHFTVRCCRRIDDDEPVIKEGNWRMQNRNHERVVMNNGEKRGYQLPIVVLVTSFNSPRSGVPGLLDLNSIETLYHEMGHAMHSMLSQTEFQHISGTRVVMDFVESPSILMEYFAKLPEVLLSTGRHYKTKEQIPLELIKQHQFRQTLFNGLETQNQLQMALLDQLYHSELANSTDFNTSQIMYHLSQSINPLPIPRPSQWQVQFSHLFTYGASYYSYTWSRKWASRIFEKHFANLKMDQWRKGGELLRRELLSCGGGRDPWIGLNNIGVSDRQCSD